MPLRLYDVSIDEMRDATQQDIDKLVRIATAYGMLKAFLHSQIGLIKQSEQRAAEFVAAKQEPEMAVIDLDRLPPGMFQ